MDIFTGMKKKDPVFHFSVVFIESWAFCYAAVNLIDVF